MFPVHSVYGTTRTHLPTPPRTRPPLDLSFNRPKQFYNDYSPPLLSQTNTFLSHLSYRNDINQAPARNAANDQANICNQNQECQQDGNLPFPRNNNQEGHDQQYQQRTSANGEGTSDGNFANNYQRNGPILNSRILKDGLAPATDVYSNLNRLCELFPDIHPAQLQRVFDECGRDFLRTIDNVLYARRFRKSLVAHMSKFRPAQRAQPQNSSVPNPQEQKPQNQTQETQEPQEEKQSQQTNRSQKKIRTQNNNSSRRGRILAYNAHPSSVSGSARKSSITSPKRNQHILPNPCTPASSGSQYQCVRKSPPPPNVFIHPFESGQQIGGAGDGTLNRNTSIGYMISHKRPHTLHYGAPPSASANLTIPTTTMASTDSPMYLTSLPPPPIRYNLSNGGLFSPWSQRTHERLDQQTTASPVRKQDDQRQQPSSNADHPSVTQQTNGQFPVNHGEALQQGSEKDYDWTQMLKSILDPISSMESSTKNSMINTAPIGTCNEANQQKPYGADGSCSYGAPVPTRLSGLIEAALDQEGEREATENQNSTLQPKTSEPENNGNQLDAETEEMVLENISRSREIEPTEDVKCKEGSLSLSSMRTRQSHRKQHNSTTLDGRVEPMEDSTDNERNDKIPEIEANVPDFSPVNQLVIDTDTWVQGEEITEEQIDDSFSRIDEDANYGHLIEI